MLAVEVVTVEESPRVLQLAGRGVLHVLHGSVGLAYAEAEHELIAQAGMRKVKVAALVQAIHQTLILFLTAAIPKAH